MGGLPQVLKKSRKAFSSLEDDDLDELHGTTNPVKSINRQSVPGNIKAVSLKPFIEHFYLEVRGKPYNKWHVRLLLPSPTM